MKKKRVFTIHLNPPILLSKIKLTPMDPTTKNARWVSFGGIELFSSDLNSKEVFQTLIENSKYKDPHRCGVYARSVKYCTNYTPLLIPQTKEGRQSPAWGAWGIYSFSRIFKIYQINLNKYGIFILISEYL